MLSRITIHNLVIVRRLDLELAAGMTALTGETGAGKSILVDALGLALGDKADPGLIRSGTERAEVSAVFEPSEGSRAWAWLEANDLAIDGECLLRRVLVREGRSRAYVNGTPVPLAKLRELGELLVDIHGQHAHQSLLRTSAQLQLLDAYGGLRDQAKATAAAYRQWQEHRKAVDELVQAASDRAARLDYLNFQIGEMQDSVVDAATLEQLDQDHDRLANAERLISECSALLELIADEDNGLRHRLHLASQRLEGLAAIDPSLGEARDLIASAGIQVDEAESALAHYRDAVDIDPERLQALDQQLGTLHDLARKHRVEVALLPDLLARLQAEVAQLENADNDLQRRQRQSVEAEKAFHAASSALSDARSAAARDLSEQVTASMQTLGMQGGRFDVIIVSDAEHPTANGHDRVSFEVAANPGQPAGALGDVASGGELSRISLAIQVATAGCGSVPTLIFDEVDVGIGGAVAEIVGQLLRRLGQQRQVLCVTHLPQVAAQAHQHARVVKATDGKTTQTDIQMLEPKARVDEIARMLGGIEITAQTRRHASEMIRSANAPEPKPEPAAGPA
jgi:DNA repair protein RecN (Recombination protein N)